MPAKTPYGVFIDNGNAYNVTTPFTPMRLTNTLFGQDGYSAEISHFGTSRSTLMQDYPLAVTAQDGKLLYCRDDAHMSVWSPGVFPMMSLVESFRCEHHEGFTLLTSRRDGIRVTWLIFVPQCGRREIWTVVVDNETDCARHISLVPVVIPAVAPVMGMNPIVSQDSAQCAWDARIGALVCHAGMTPACPRPLDLILGSATPPEQTWCSARSFFGSALAPQYPEALFQKGRRNEANAGELSFLALRCAFRIPAGQSLRTDFTIAVLASPTTVETPAGTPIGHETADRLFEEAQNSLRRRWNRIRVQTPDEDLDVFVNTWCKKGCGYVFTNAEYTRARLLTAGTIGMVDEDVMRREVLAALARQGKDGNLPPRSRHLPPEADGAIWLILGLCEYLKLSNDMAFLDEPVRYCDGSGETVRRHIERAVAYLGSAVGPHGLPLMRGVDTGDHLSIDDPDAESVVSAMQLAYAYRELHLLHACLRNAVEAEQFLAKHTRLRDTINQVAWDEIGEYYVRAFVRDRTIGGSSSTGARLFAEPQCWAMLADLAPRERLASLAQTLDIALGTEFGTALLTPPYTSFDPLVGSLSATLPGCGSNGAVLSSISAMKACADALTGRGSHAYASLIRMMPSLNYDPTVDSGVQPHVLPTGLSTHPDSRGRAFGAWLTTGYAWAMRAVVEGIFGLRAAYGGIEFVPALPEGWTEARIDIERRNCRYRVAIVGPPPRPGVQLMPACQGNRNVRLPADERPEPRSRSEQRIALTVDGVPQQGRFLSFRTEGEHTVEIRVGGPVS